MLEPLYFFTTPILSDRHPTSWLEKTLKGKWIQMRLSVGNQPIVIQLQDTTYLAQVEQDIVG